MSGPFNQLKLGPIVGHTDHHSTRIWIRVRDNPENYTLRIRKRGVFQFASTEGGAPEFGTAIAVADKLRSNWRYEYQVLRKGRVLPRRNGTFRTMPPPGSLAEVLFVTISCSHRKDEGLWQQLGQYLEDAKPGFLLMIGDQVYLDSGDDDNPSDKVWPTYLYSSRDVRRRAMVRKYEQHWKRDDVRQIMANIPTYMMWDDHDIRDGWGSWACDSPTLAARYPAGAKFADACNTYFNDARDLYHHFQMSHNPPAPDALPFPPYGRRQGLPFVLRCGRLLVLMLDDRGARDVFRESNPVLGDEQWKFIDHVFANLAFDIDALAIVTPVPLTLMAPDSLGQLLLGERMDNVELFKQGKIEELLTLQHTNEKNKGKAFANMVVADVTQKLGNRVNPDWGDMNVKDIDDMRDQWSHHFCRPEQERLIRAAGKARLTNRASSKPRSLVFLGGDFHAGGIFQVSVSHPEFRAESMVSSGIAQQIDDKSERIVGLTFDEDFEIADGIRAELQSFVPVYNFGITKITFGGSTANIVNQLWYQGDADYWTIRPLPRVSYPLSKVPFDRFRS